jgi:hypothetical protein
VQASETLRIATTDRHQNIKSAGVDSVKHDVRISAHLWPLFHPNQSGLRMQEQGRAPRAPLDTSSFPQSEGAAGVIGHTAETEAGRRSAENVTLLARQIEFECIARSLDGKLRPAVAKALECTGSRFCRYALRGPISPHRAVASDRPRVDTQPALVMAFPR